MLKSPLKREGFFLSGGFSAPAVGFLPPGLEENVQQRNNNQTGCGTQKHSVKYRNADGDTAGGTGPGGHNHRQHAENERECRHQYGTETFFGADGSRFDD